MRRTNEQIFQESRKEKGETAQGKNASAIKCKKGKGGKRGKGGKGM